MVVRLCCCCCAAAADDDGRTALRHILVDVVRCASRVRQANDRPRLLQVIEYKLVGVGAAADDDEDEGRLW